MPFRPSDEQRISDAVQAVERRTRNVRAHRSRWHGKGGPRFEWGKLDGPLVYNSTATVSIWRGDPMADTGDNVTAYPSFLMTSGTISAGIRVRLIHQGGKWIVIDHNQAMLVQAAVNMGGGLDTTDPTITVDAAVVMAPIGGQVAAAVTSINNTFSWEADDNAIVVGAWNQNDPSFDAIQVECLV